MSEKQGVPATHFTCMSMPILVCRHHACTIVGRKPPHNFVTVRAESRQCPRAYTANTQGKGRITGGKMAAQEQWAYRVGDIDLIRIRQQHIEVPIECSYESIHRTTQTVLPSYRDPYALLAAQE